MGGIGDETALRFHIAIQPAERLIEGDDERPHFLRHAVQRQRQGMADIPFRQIPAQPVERVKPPVQPQPAEPGHHQPEDGHRLHALQPERLGHRPPVAGGGRDDDQRPGPALPVHLRQARHRLDHGDGAERLTAKRDIVEHRRVEPRRLGWIRHIGQAGDEIAIRFENPVDYAITGTGSEYAEGGRGDQRRDDAIVNLDLLADGLGRGGEDPVGDRAGGEGGIGIGQPGHDQGDAAERDGQPGHQTEPQAGAGTGPGGGHDAASGARRSK